ncbi:hypothetical protein MKX01_008429 [Papaver californicum]|nr:hypothetical protein MKX01_008429 [Papaver californicum]
MGFVLSFLFFSFLFVGWRSWQLYSTHEGVLRRVISGGIGGSDTDLFGKRVVETIGTKLSNKWSFAGGSRVVVISDVAKLNPFWKCCGVSASWYAGSQIASSAFTLGTVAVLPFYTLMVLAPKAELLPGIAKMFSSEMTLASAWIHLLAVDLFAARQVFLEGLEFDVETRHSVSLCLLFCPIGIIVHVITKLLTKRLGNT